MTNTILTVFAILLFTGIASGLLAIWWVREETNYELEEARLLMEAEQINKAINKEN